jgi:hypothetical protein
VRLLMCSLAIMLAACGPAPTSRDSPPNALQGEFDPASDPDATPEDVELIRRGGELLLSSGECAHIHGSYVLPDESGNPVPGRYIIECDDFTWRYFKRTAGGEVRLCGRAREDCARIE